MPDGSSKFSVASVDPRKKTHHINILSLCHLAQILEATTCQYCTMCGKCRYPSSASDEGCIHGTMGGMSDSDADVLQVCSKQSTKSNQLCKKHYKRPHRSSPDVGSEAQSRPTTPLASRQTPTVTTNGQDGPIGMSDDVALPSGISQQSSQRLLGAHDLWVIFEKGNIEKDLPSVCRPCK